MSTKPAYQFDHAGLLQGVTEADESPLELGVYHLPARCTLVPPPDDVPDDKWPRFNGRAWDLVTRPQRTADAPENPVDKLKAFFDANPDVAALFEAKQGVSPGGV